MSVVVGSDVRCAVLAGTALVPIVVVLVAAGSTCM